MRILQLGVVTYLLCALYVVNKQNLLFTYYGVGLHLYSTKPFTFSLWKTCCLFVASASISNFLILKKFNVTIHPPKAPKIIEVIWRPPIPHWIKCNTDGSSRSHSSACGGIFGNHDADLLLCFAENTGECNAFHAELIGAIKSHRACQTISLE